SRTGQRSLTALSTTSLALSLAFSAVCFSEEAAWSARPSSFSSSSPVAAPADSFARPLSSSALFANLSSTPMIFSSSVRRHVKPQPVCALLGPGGPVDPGRRYRYGDQVAGGRARTAVAARAPIRSRVTRHCAQRLLSGHSTCSRPLLSGHSTCLRYAACTGPRPAVCPASSHKYRPPRPPAARLFP